MRLDLSALRGLLAVSSVVLTVALPLGTGCGSEPEQPQVSSKQRVLAKSGAVWGRDLSTGLGLEDWELCEELGQYDCISDAHLITLGGTEPATLGIDQPLASASVSAPIAADRVAVAACGERLARDEQGPAVVFGPVLEENTEAAREAVSEQLVRRILARHPTEAEVEALTGLWPAVSALSSEPLREWSVGACVMVATSTEALFY